MKSVNEFDVGTIVYFISSKNEKVIPALVAEKIVRTSLANSSKVTYILEIRTGKSIKSVEVDPINVDLFSNPQEIRAFMITRTTKAIDDLIAKFMFCGISPVYCAILTAFIFPVTTPTTLLA